MTTKSDKKKLVSSISKTTKAKTKTKAGKQVKTPKVRTVEKKVKSIWIPEPEKARMTIRVVGLTELVVNRMSAKYVNELRERDLGVGVSKVRGRQNRVPEEEFKAAAIILNEKKKIYGASVVWFKHALCDAASELRNRDLTKKTVAKYVWFEGDFMPILGPNGKPLQPRMREDIVRDSGMVRAPRLRWRPSFAPGWMVDLNVLIRDINMVPPDVIPALITRSGIGGVGEGRPSKTPTLGWGQFETLKT